MELLLVVGLQILDSLLSFLAFLPTHLVFEHLKHIISFELLPLEDNDHFVLGWVSLEMAKQVDGLVVRLIVEHLVDYKVLHN